MKGIIILNNFLNNAPILLNEHIFKNFFITVIFYELINNRLLKRFEKKKKNSSSY